MNNDFEQFKYYPGTEEVESWIESIWQMAEKAEYKAELLSENGFVPSIGLYHTKDFQYVKFSVEGMNDFYGYWQPAWSEPAPLVVHVPGYGSEISLHPEIAAGGYNVLHISPMGYTTPTGIDVSKRKNDNWPVLPDTVISGAEEGYKLWLLNCVIATKWAMNLPQVLNNRVSFFGTSQGGGGALLLGSLFKDKGVRCIAADVPFLTNFPMAAGRGAYAEAAKGLDAIKDKAAGWRALGFIDTLSHAHRLTVPVMLTQGSIDDVCPPETIQSLYEKLPGTRSITYLKGMGHRYTTEFIAMVQAWFRLFA